MYIHGVIKHLELHSYQLVSNFMILGLVHGRLYPQGNGNERIGRPCFYTFGSANGRIGWFHSKYPSCFFKGYDRYMRLWPNLLETLGIIVDEQKKHSEDVKRKAS